jgi:acyl-CoA thioesterase I
LVGRFSIGAVLAMALSVAGCTDDAAAPASNNMGFDAGNATAPEQDSASRANARHIIAFGDSLYAGYNLPQGQGFAPELQRALDRAGVAVQVHNAGVSGDTSAAALERLTFTLDGLNAKPDLVIVGLGGNDMLRGISPKETQANMTAILDELKKRQIPVMLTGMMASPNMGADYVAQFNSIFPQLAKRYDVPIYPFFLDGVVGHRDLQLPDGIHPNEKGVDLIVGKITPMVEDALRL